MQIQKILLGAGAGVIYGLTTFAKSQGEKFDIKKLGVTVAIGAGAGIINSFADWPMETSYEFMLSIGAVTIIENGAKAINRKILPLFFNKN